MSSVDRRMVSAVALVVLLISEPAAAFFCFNFGFGGGNRNRMRSMPPPPPPMYMTAPPPYTYRLPSIMDARPTTPTDVTATKDRKPEPFPESVWPPQQSPASGQ